MSELLHISSNILAAKSYNYCLVAFINIKKAIKPQAYMTSVFWSLSCLDVSKICRATTDAIRIMNQYYLVTM